jgi:DNA-binding protein HU-beta
MNKLEIVELLSEKTGLTKAAAAKALEATLDIILATLSSGEPVIFINFGTFVVRKRAAREGRNPQTGEKITIKASKVVSFKAGKALKEAVKDSH